MNDEHKREESKSKNGNINHETKDERTENAGDIPRVVKRRPGRPRKTDTNNSKSLKNESKKTRKTKKSVKSPPKKSSKVKSEKTEDVSNPRQNSKPKINYPATREIVDKNEIKSRPVRKRTRVRSQQQHNEAIRFLYKRIFFAKCQEEINKFENMINKLEDTTRII